MPFVYHKDKSVPSNNAIFVFGSNLLGIHGAGAALEALNHGAVLGKGIGLQGNSYAIPTKETLTSIRDIESIKKSILDFENFVRDNPDKDFFITRIGCGFAGFLNEEIAPLFKPLKQYTNNFSFAEDWKQYLENN